MSQPLSSGMTAVPAEDLKKETITSQLQYLPVGLFGSTVAMSGLSIAWGQASILFSLPAYASIGIALLAWKMYVLLVSAYFLKAVKYWPKVKAELTHPVTSNFLGTVFISAVLLSVVTAPHSLLLARIVWLAGTIGGSVFMYIHTARLLRKELSITDAVPPLLIPGLTLLNAVVASGKMEFGWLGKEMDLMLFSIGIVYVFAFFIIILYRLIYKETVSSFLMPTLLLMSAPFEVGVSAYMSQVGQIDPFASVMFFAGFFIFVLTFFHVFRKGLPFMVSWWSSCFSIGALTNAALRYSIISGGLVEKGIAGLLLVASTLLITVTFVITVRRQLGGKLLKP